MKHGEAVPYVLVPLRSQAHKYDEEVLQMEEWCKFRRMPRVLSMCVARVTVQSHCHPHHLYYRVVILLTLHLQSTRPGLLATSLPLALFCIFHLPPQAFGAADEEKLWNATRH